MFQSRRPALPAQPSKYMMSESLALTCAACAAIDGCDSSKDIVLDISAVQRYVKTP